MNKHCIWNITNAQNGKTQIDLYGYVGGDGWWVEGFNENDFVKQFRQIDEYSEIDISINSFGGAVYTALSIYSLLKTHKGAITIRVDGAAMSAATIITSVPNAKVIMPKGAMMMIHKVSTAVSGDSEDLKKTAAEMEKLEDNIISIYAEKTGKTVEEIKPLVDAETYFTAQEAVDFGLADEMDETTTVINSINGDSLMLNGLTVNKTDFDFSKMPRGIDINAGAPQQATAKPKKEDHKMTLEEIRAEYPEIVNTIAQEAAEVARVEATNAERARIKAIEDIAIAGYEEMIAKAKFEDGTTAADLAMAILKAEKNAKANIAVARVEDAKDLDGVVPEGNMGMPDIKADADEAARDAMIAAGKAAFNGKL